MTLAQENLILALIGSEPDGFKPIEIQKLMFMYARIGEDIPSYDFIPYMKGCYSPTLAQDVHKLGARGLLREVNPESNDKRTWTLTELGRIRLYDKRATTMRVSRFRRTYPLRGMKLIADVYRKYPYWAVNSTIKDLVLKDDAEALAKIEAARPTTSTPLASIGYEGRSFENYLNALISNGIKILCDVRKNPISRKYGFSKSTMENACESVGIEYRHFPELGIPSYERTDLKYQSDYDELFARYEKTILLKAEDSVEAISRLVSDGSCVALTCFEANPLQCHRTRVLSAIEQRTGIIAKLI